LILMLLKAQTIEIDQFSDGKLLFHAPNNSLRLVFRDGTINSIFNINSTNNSISFKSVPLSDNLIMLMHCNAGNIFDANNGACFNGTIIDLNGTVVVDGIQLGGVKQITTNNIPSVGFLGISYTFNQYERHYINWIKFRFPKQDNTNDRNLQIANGTIFAHLNYSLGIDLKVFNSIDGSHVIAYTSVLNITGWNNRNYSYLQDPSYLIVSVCFYNEYTNKMNDPIKIYDSLQNLGLITLDTFDCSSGFNSDNLISNICYFELEYSKSYNSSYFEQTNSFWIITFSSSGAVFQSESLLYSHGILKNRQDGGDFSLIGGYMKPLPFGELVLILFDSYCLISSKNSNQPYSNLTNENWNSTQDMYTRAKKLYATSLNFGNNFSIIIGKNDFGIMPNNSLWILLQDYQNNYGIIAVDIRKINADAGYENPIIKTIYPEKNSNLQFPIQADFNLSILFYVPVIPSLGNISIYQGGSIRQTYPANTRCKNINGTIITCTVFTSTFNRENKTYVITADNDFVKSSTNNEPLFGIKQNIWIVSTSKRESTTASLCLTEDGFKYYKNLSSKESFFNMLQQQLVVSIPIDNLNQLIPTGRINPDSTSPNKALVEFLVNEAESTLFPDTDSIISDLNTLINNKDASSLVQQNLTVYLDASYGFIPNPNLWYEFRFYFLGIIIGCVVLGIIYFWLRKRNPKWFGENISIISIFVVISGADVEILNLLNSELGGLKFFSSPFSEKAIKRILYVTILNIFIEDLPHLIIQLLLGCSIAFAIFIKSILSYEIKTLPPTLTIINCEKEFNLLGNKTCSKCEQTLFNSYSGYQKSFSRDGFNPIDLTKTPCAIGQALWQLTNNMTYDKLKLDDTKVLDEFCNNLTPQVVCTVDIANGIISSIKNDCATELSNYNTYDATKDSRLYYDGQLAEEVIFNYYINPLYKNVVCAKSGGGYCAMYPNYIMTATFYDLPQFNLAPKNKSTSTIECTDCAKKTLVKVYRYLQTITDPIVKKGLRDLFSSKYALLPANYPSYIDA
ncbi:25743_t:CDS:2, partial [Gigaspora margarita]